MQAPLLTVQLNANISMLTMTNLTFYCFAVIIILTKPVCLLSLKKGGVVPHFHIRVENFCSEICFLQAKHALEL